MKQRFPKAHFEPKGLLLTEGIVTIPNGQGQNNLAVDWTLEFIDDHQRVFLAQDIVAENEYEVILAAGGLYRYRTGDRVRCEGFTKKGPVLTFQGRESLTSDLVGEKLTEPFVEKCLDGIPGFRMLVPLRTHPPVRSGRGNHPGSFRDPIGRPALPASLTPTHDGITNWLQDHFFERWTR